MDYKNELTKIETQVEQQKLEKARLEERKRQLLEEKTKVLKELKVLEITEDKLEETIEEIEIELQTGIKKCQEILKN